MQGLFGHHDNQGANMSTATMKQALAGARSRIRVSEAEMERTGAAYVSAVVIGIGSKGHSGQPPMMSKLSFAGVPGTIVLALLAKGGASFASGTVGNILNGVGDAASIIGIAKFVEGADIAGMAGADDEVSGRRRRKEAAAARRLEERLSQRMSNDDRELESLEG